MVKVANTVVDPGYVVIKETVFSQLVLHLISKG